MSFDPDRYEAALTAATDNYQRIVHELVTRRKELGISQEQMVEMLEFTLADIKSFEEVESTQRNFMWVCLYASALGGTFQVTADPLQPIDPNVRVSSHRKPGPLGEVDPELSRIATELVPDVDEALASLRT